jgi:single-strand DNA-binding protein
MSINKVILLGNLGSDPELHKTSADKAVCTFSIATDRAREDSNGTAEQTTEWHNVVCFGTTAECCASYLKKGRQVYLEGRIKTDRWKDESGTVRTTNKIVANVIQFLGKGNDTKELTAKIDEIL